MRGSSGAAEGAREGDTHPRERSTHERVEELRRVASGPRLREAEIVGLLLSRRAMVGAEQHVEPRGEVCEVMARPLNARVVVMVELRRPEEHAERTKREADVGMNKDSPHRPEHDEAGQDPGGEAHRDQGEVLAKLGEEAVDRVLPVRRQPVEVRRAVVHRVEAP